MQCKGAKPWVKFSNMLLMQPQYGGSRKRTQIAWLETMRLTIRGDEDQGLISSEEVCDKSRHIVPAPWISVQGCRGAEQAICRPLDDHLTILSTSKAFNYFRARRDEIRCAFDFP